MIAATGARHALSVTEAIIAAMPREELFDLAVERADTYLSRLLPGWERSEPSAQRLIAATELWYLRTRFVYRVPLEDVVAALLTKPPNGTLTGQGGVTVEKDGAGTLVWRGGQGGCWSQGPQQGSKEDPEANGG